MTAYLDHTATTPMSASLRAAYADALGVVGNPSSIHSAGQAARALLEGGREAVAASIGADPMETILTGGGTESINLAIKGMFWQRHRESAGRARRILLTRAEHHASLDAAEWLAKDAGAELNWIDVDAVGRIRLDGPGGLSEALADDPGGIALVTALWANNEVGTLQPVGDIVARAAGHGIPVHLDAVAAYGQVPIDVHATGAAAVSISAHKVGGPVGIGALYLARDARPDALLHGGDQQRARSGTLDAAGAHVFGLAATAANSDLPAHARDLERLRDRLVTGIMGSTFGSAAVGAAVAIEGAVLRGDPDPAGRLPGNAHITFDGCEGDSLLFLLDHEGFAVSTGSACQAGVPEASHVLLAMGLSEADARGALRFSLGAGNTMAEVRSLLDVLPSIVTRARSAGLNAPGTS